MVVRGLADLIPVALDLAGGIDGVGGIANHT